MISVVAYGRNDSSGYNAHRRIALSLNCIAEVLDDASDEIVFVDYNTPDELPTLPEALADTLTERCRARLRVLRVRAEIHERRFSKALPLPIVEPIARNVAARRADPANRWLLMTNTDMVFLPLTAASVTETCARLPDGFYTLPRFELPEWVWEQLPRSDPARVIGDLRSLGPALRLDEVTTSHDWLRFDSAGDFQLVLRDDFFGIDGFDEEMTLGWHVDANLGRRMLLHRGSIESLENEIAGYHCNHLRTATTYQSSAVANDLHRFVHALEEAGLPAQRESWGLAGTDIEEVDLAPDGATSFVAAVVAATRGSRPPTATDARDEKWRLEYHSGHVLAFVADAIRVAPKGSVVAYVGVNTVLEGMLRELVDLLAGLPPLKVAEAREDLAAADVVIVDLGVDSSLVDGALSDAKGPLASTLRTGLIGVFDAFRAFVETERDRVRSGGHPRQIVLVNSAAIYWNAFARAHLHTGPTTPHSGVRRAVVKLVPDDDVATRSAALRALQLRRWITRRDPANRSLALTPGRKVCVGSLENFAGFGDGWGFPEPAGISPRGSRSTLSLSVAGLGDGDRLRLSFDGARDEHGRSPASAAIVDAHATAGTLELDSQIGYARNELVWDIELPQRAGPASDVVDLMLGFGADPSGLRLRELTLLCPGRGFRHALRSLVQSSSGRTAPRH